MKWTQADINKVRDISIAQTFGKPKGRKIKIVCPMPDHRDNTPSFMVDEGNGFHCFGCKCHGQGFIDFATEIALRTGEAETREEAFKMIMEEYS